MNDYTLRLALCRNITARAHLAGAEAGDAARRRYWRELAACQLLMGHPWPQAEALGVEP